MNYISLARNLISNFKQTSDDRSKVDNLKQLKIMLLNFRSLPPSNEPINPDEYMLAREIMELEMERALDKKDGKSFELSYLKIKQFYFDYKNMFTRSEKMLYFVGIYLLHLLANNRTTEFCTELELLDIQDLNNNYIRVSRDLEQCIMEGNYKHIFSIKSSINNPHYNYYLEKFDEAIKFQIARSAEKSYDSLKLNDAVQLLMLNSTQELNNFIKHELETLENREINWDIRGDRLEFLPVK